MQTESSLESQLPTTLTEKSANQSALDESETVFRTIATAARDAVIVVDSEDRIRFWNPAAAEMFGFSEVEALGERCHQLITPERFRAKALAAQATFRESGTGDAVGQTLELQALRRDGTEITVELSLSAIQLDGEWAAVAIIRDISERKREEQISRLTQLSVEQSADAVLWFTPDGSLSYVNQAACQTLGYTREELLSLNVKESYAYLGEDAWRKMWDDLRRWRSLTIEAVQRTKGGRTFPVELTANYLETEAGEVCCAFARDISERKQIQEAIEESEAKYRGLWNSMNEGCAVCRLIRDEDGEPVDYRIIDVNPAFAKMTGCSREMALSTNPARLFQVPAPPHLQEFADVEATEVPISFETSFPSIDKTFRLSAFSLAKGRFAVSFVDLTQQRRARAALRESEERYQELFTAVQEGILVFDENEKIIYGNPACAHILEVDQPEALKDRSFWDFVPQHERAKMRAQIESCAQGKSSKCELGILTAGGADKTALLSVSPRFDAERKFHGAFAALLDITDRKRIEEELRQSQEQLQAILENVGIGIAVISPQMEILSLNRQMQEWFPDVDAKSRPICHKVFNNPPSETLCSYCPTFKTLSDGEIHEAVTRTPAGTEFRTYRVISSPIKSETGDIIAAIEIVEDLTESHRAETVKRDLERRLQETSKLEAVGSLASGIAHEINTPIQFVGDNTHYLSDCFDTLLKLITKHQQLWLRARQGDDLTQLDEEWHQAENEADLEYTISEVPTAINQTLDGVQRVGQIVRSMKEFAHTDRKETSACDLNRMLDTTLTVARNELKYVADVVTDYDPELPEIDCHRDELNQVFLNLLINAAHTIA
ncbi:MAG: PAS domain S-box protein, partial [bacterium]